MPDKSPRNQAGQKPTRNPKETAKRLEEKAKEQRGGANRTRTMSKARSGR